MRKLVALMLVALASTAWAQYEVERTETISVGELEGLGRIMNPSISPDARALSFEFLAADGETMEVYQGQIDNAKVYPPVITTPRPVMPSKKQDVFSLDGPLARPVSEQPGWGKPNNRGQVLALAATRKEASRGGKQINFDIYYTAPGKRRFLTEHPENDSAPTFHPDGELLAFASGRTGQGDIYLYDFFAEGDPVQRITFEETGSELYPTWSPDGAQLAYIGHLGSADHLLIIDKVTALLKAKDEAGRKGLVRAATRNLTTGWPHSCLAPDFSPDGKWIAFYMHPKGSMRTDLYVVKAQGGEPVLLMENVVAGTRKGPAWSPQSDGVFVVQESAQEMNPIVWVPMDPGKPRKALKTNTQLNTDLSVWVKGKTTYLLFTAQGGGEEDAEKRWQKIFLSRLTRP